MQPRFTSADPRRRTRRRGRDRAESAQRRGAIARHPTGAIEIRRSEEGRLMKAKRPAQPPRAGDRRGGNGQGFPEVGQQYPAAALAAADLAPASPRRRPASRAPVAVRAADHAGRPAGRASGPREERHPGQGPGQGAESEGAQGCSAATAGAPARSSWRRSTCGRAPWPPRSRSSCWSSVSLGAGLGSHAVAVHRRRRALLSAGQRPSAHRIAAAGKGSARARRAGGAVRAGVGRGGPRPGHDPDPRHRTPGPGSRRQLGGGRHARSPPRVFRRHR